MRRHHRDKLTEAVARMKHEGQSQEPPEEIVAETHQRIVGSGPCLLPIRPLQPAIRNSVRWAAAAAVFVVVGYTVGRVSAPKPLNLDQVRETLTPTMAAAIEPALRARVADEIRDDYQIAMVGLYVRVKEELTDQYRNDLNRLAVQMLAASNAVTNELLTQLVQNIDTAQTQDLRRITRVLYEIEMKRVQDKTQLASGLQTLAYRTDAIAQFVAHTRPTGFELPPVEPRQTDKERNKP